MENFSFRDFIEQFKTEAIDKILFKSEKEDLYAGLAIFNISIDDFLALELEMFTHDTFKMSDAIKIQNIMQNVVDNITEDQEEIIDRFLIIKSKIPYYTIEFYKDRQSYDIALGIAKIAFSALEKLIMRMMPEPPPDYIMSLKQLYEKEIKDLQDKLSIPVKTVQFQRLKSEQSQLESKYITSVEVLNKVYELLLSNKPPLIEHNPNFIESFCCDIVHPHHKTNWLCNRTELFYLLYLLQGNNKNNGNSIPSVVFNLFSFPKMKKTSKHTTQVSYNKFIVKIKDARYIESKQKQITAIYNSLLSQMV